MKKFLLVFFFAFLFGFLVHAYFFADFLPTQINFLGKKALGIPEPTKSVGKEEVSLSTVYVDYQDGKFKPANIVSRRGNHIMITNRDKKELMWLQSDNPLLNTTRGYGFSERFDVIPDKVGTFKVTNKVNSAAVLAVTVK